MSQDPTRPSTQRPYLLRAMHEWMVDNGMTPHIVVDAGAPDLKIPHEHVKDGKLVLNVSYAATRALQISNRAIEFEARFGGAPRWIEIPVGAVLGIYARETGQGMIFSSEQEPAQAEPKPDTENRPSGNRPSLKLIK